MEMNLEIEVQWRFEHFITFNICIIIFYFKINTFSHNFFFI